MQQQATTTSSSPSALLCCLSCLDVDAWAQVLLPKLVKQGSARDVALTCTQLRDFCYGTVQHLNLSGIATSGGTTVESWVQSIPQHFPNCTSVKLLLHKEASYHATPYMLPALARLPKLNSISVRVDGVLRPLRMTLMLHMLRTQLAGGLRCLSLDLQQSWNRDGVARAWMELGQFTMLSKLEVKFGQQVTLPVMGQDLLPLTNLHSLQSLAVDFSDRVLDQPLLSARLARGLTSLTNLSLSGCPVACLRHVGSCAALKALTVDCHNDAEELCASEWAALGQLAGLAELSLFNATILSPTDECCAALGKLSRLQRVASAQWSVDVLPALSACTQLTGISGGWEQGNSEVAGVTLPSVRALDAAWGCPPFAALPNLATVEQAGPLLVAAVAEMAQHCTRLELFVVVDDLEHFTSLPADALWTERAAAIRALTALTNLKRLDWFVQDGPEVAALVDVVGTLLPGRRFRWLKVCLDVALPPTSLMHLAKLQGLRNLTLQLPPAMADELAGHAADFLGALSGVCTVVIVGVQSDPVVDKYMDAWHALQAAGMPCTKGLAA